MVRYQLGVEMSRREISFDPLILEKIDEQRASTTKFLDLGDRRELSEFLMKQTDEKNKRLNEIYEKAKEILSISQLKVFEAVFKHGYKIPALARTHNRKRSTYYTHYYRALDKLKEALIEGGEVKKKEMSKKRIKEISSRDWESLALQSKKSVEK